MKKLMNSGFTLIELMVVVAIIGILSSVGVPQYQKFQSKSRTVEAKTNLSGIYMVEQVFSSDYGTFAHCIKDGGFDGGGTSALRYYTFGFGDALGGTLTITGAGGSCVAAATLDSTYWMAGKGLGGAAPLTELTPWDYISGNGDAFTAAAVGRIGKGLTSVWTVDENKNLTIAGGHIGY